MKNEMKETLKVIFLVQFNNPKLRKFFKFGIVGGVGFVINFLGLRFFNGVYKSLPLPIGAINFLANATASEISIISNFIFNNLWTFKSERITNVSQVFSKFMTFNLSSIVGGVLVPSLIIGLGTQMFGDSYRYLFLVLAVFGFTVPYNWFVYNKFIWKSKSTKN
jgi:dolichol-phosphate mannosyltransferase